MRKGRQVTSRTEQELKGKFLWSLLFFAKKNFLVNEVALEGRGRQGLERCGHKSTSIWSPKNWERRDKQPILPRDSPPTTKASERHVFLLIP